MSEQNGSTYYFVGYLVKGSANSIYHHLATTFCSERERDIFEASIELQGAVVFGSGEFECDEYVFHYHKAVEGLLVLEQYTNIKASEVATITEPGVTSEANIITHKSRLN